MRREDVLRVLQERPFRPLRLHQSNNIVHDIRHPDMAIVTPSSIVVGISAPDSTPPAADDFVIVSLMHVVQIEHVAPAPPSSN
jgi:hypothetical protein